jgi:hypothetical protein
MLTQVCEQLYTENKDRKTKRLLEAKDFFEVKTELIVTQKQTDISNFGSKPLSYCLLLAF